MYCRGFLILAQAFACLKGMSMKSCWVTLRRRDNGEVVSELFEVPGEESLVEHVRRSYPGAQIVAVQAKAFGKVGARRPAAE